MSVLQKLIVKFNENKNQQLYVRIIQGIQNSEKLWIAFSENSNNYFLGSEQGRAAAYIFSEKEYYEKYYVHITAKGKKIKAVENPAKYRMALLADLYRCGFECIVVDNGQTYMRISLFDIIKKPEPQKNLKQVGAITNPELMRTANWIFQENERDKIDTRLWQMLFTEIFKAEYIVAADTKELKIGKNTGRDFNITDDSKVGFPILENNDGKKYYPFFTDWNEYRKFDTETKLTIMAAGFKDMKTFMNKADGIVINPFGINIIINQEMLLMISEASKEMSKSLSQVSVGDPKRYPLQMVRKISEKLWDKDYIDSAYLKVMLKNRDISYLVALDGRLPEHPEALYDEIAETVLTYSENIPIDFIDYSSDFAKKVFKDSKPFYTKKEKP